MLLLHNSDDNANGDGQEEGGDEVLTISTLITY